MTTITQRTKDALADDKIIGDGHTIFSPKFYAPHFTEDELRKARLIQTLESDYSDPKSTIFDKDGNPVESMEGVYNRSAVRWVLTPTTTTTVVARRHRNWCVVSVGRWHERQSTFHHHSPR
jgi:hypothetical protein